VDIEDVGEEITPVEELKFKPQSLEMTKMSVEVPVEPEFKIMNESQ
jgi:hypothetical protein